MAKAATLKKTDSKRLSAAASRAAATRKRPVLKVVKSQPAPSKSAKTKPVKPVLKTTTALAHKAEVKPVAKKASSKEFRVGHYVVYPTHGVGRIIGEESQAIGGCSIRMLVIAFEKDRMTLRVPVNRASVAGLRHVSGLDQMQKVFVTLKSRPRVSRGMWSRRAQEYETKINSGNILFIAEVVRDLHHNVDQAERSYSERMIYESALSRLVGELAAAEGSDQKVAGDKLLKLLRAHQKAAA